VARSPARRGRAARQLCAAGEHANALAFITRWHGPISGAGLDHLLLDTLEQLRAALPIEQWRSISCGRATLVRRGAISQAEDVLLRIAGEASARRIRALPDARRHDRVAARRSAARRGLARGSA